MTVLVSSHLLVSYAEAQIFVKSSVGSSTPGQSNSGNGKDSSSNDESLKIDAGLFVSTRIGWSSAPLATKGDTTITKVNEGVLVKKNSEQKFINTTGKVKHMFFGSNYLLSTKLKGRFYSHCYIGRFVRKYLNKEDS